MKNVFKKFSYVLVLLCLIAVAAGQNMDGMLNNGTATYDFWQSIGVYLWN